MKIVIPISPADAHLVEDFTKLYKLLGGTPRQDVKILPTKGCLAEAQKMAEELRFSAKSVKVIPWDRDNNGVWPLPGNLMWQHAVIELMKEENAGDSQTWYYMEMDNTPRGPGWADKLEAEHAMSGAKFCGAVVPTRLNINGQMTTDRFIPGQPENIPHMVGTGMYPKDVGKETQGLWRFPKGDMPWDVYLRYIINRSVCATKLIAHHWGTVNYTEKNGVIAGENSPHNPFGTDHSGPISNDAVVVHGCKDNSLLKLTIEKYEKVAPITDKETTAEYVAAIEAATPVVLPPAKPGVSYDRTADRAFSNLRTQTKVIEETVEKIEKKKRGRPKKQLATA